ncbi:MAG: glutamate--tRNA ligase [Fimbriimonadaceae bacterium]
MSVRVRFAPSPTGRMHVGALRTALYDSLFARSQTGTNILRIEDTDRGRYSAEAEAEFIEAMYWAGIEFEEGPHVGGTHAPYRQSERKTAGIYEPLIRELLEKDLAYKAFETSEELDEMRQFQQINKQPVGYYGGEWRDASPKKVEEAEQAGRPFVIRLRMPRDKRLTMEDVVRGRIEWDSNDVDDPVLIKADGMPTYHFAAMVDDHLMGITHVIRGEEWISSCPKHIWLFDAFGWERPIFVHCPVIVGKDGKKLSKRHGATSVLDYRAMGFLPSALKNFVALIGWAPGDDREVLSDEELVSAFSLNGLQPSPGRFDFEKLLWMNGHHIRSRTVDDLLRELEEYVSRDETAAFWRGYEPDPGEPIAVKCKPHEVPGYLGLLRAAIASDRVYAAQVLALEQERADTLAAFGEACAFFFYELPPMDEKAVEKWLKQDHVPLLLEFLIESLSSGTTADDEDSASAEWCESLVRGFAEKHGFDKLGPVVHPTRVALTGKTTGPGLFELMAVLGRTRMVKRLVRATKLRP